MNIVEYGIENTEVIVLLHGGGLSWWNYREAAGLLARRFHVVLPILDGHAGSDAPFVSIEQAADRVIACIDREFGGQVLMMGGLSLGGQVLAEILSRRGDICRYALIESALVLPMKLTAELTGSMLSACFPLIKKRWFSKLQFRSLRINPELFELYYRDTVRITKEDMISFLRANAAYRVGEALSGCRAKALVAVGGREQPIMKRSATRLAGLLPEAELSVFEGLYHGELSINQAEKYAETILRLIER